jgi:SSS family solute:Na+ symporter
MLGVLDWSIIAAFIALSAGITLLVRKKAGKNLESFFLGGRNLPWLVAGVSMVATTFAADTPLAVNELVYQNGISGNWLWWNFLAGGMLTVFFFSRLWRRAGVLTEVEFAEIRYSGRPAALLRGFKAVYLGLFMNVLIIGWVNVAMMTILEVFFDLPRIDSLLYTGGLMLLVALYSSISGLLGVAITDSIQFVLAMTGSIILAIIVVQSPEIGGIESLKSKLPAGSLSFFPQIGEAGAGTSLTIGLGAFLAFATMQWWSSWYPGAEPGGGGYIAQRMMSVKSEKDAFWATLFFQVAHYCIRPWPWIIVGLCAVVLYPDLSDADSKFGYVMAMKDYLPPGLKGLLLAGFLAAYMSTISTQLNWGSSYLTSDVYKRFINKNTSDSHQVNVARVITVLLMIVGLAVSSQIEQISGVWLFIIECGAGLGLVLILRWYWWRINAWSEITATLAPFVAYGVGKWVFDLEFPNSFFLTVSFTTVCWVLVTFLTKPTDDAKLKSFYAKVKPLGSWGKFELPGEKEATKLWHLFAGWILAVVLTYSILFLTGYSILLEWDSALKWLVSALISLVMLLFLDKKTSVLSK